MSTPENTPSTATSSREARRRRIVERGSDRLALITGRIQSLPPPTDSGDSPSISQDHIQHPFDPDLPSSDTINREDEGSTPLSHNDPINEISRESIGPGPVIPECETGVEASEVPLLISYIKDQQPSQLSSTSLNTHHSTPERHVEPITRRLEFCTTKDISSAVTSTEWTRICCALAAAIIVVFSYVGFPILDSYIIKNVVLFRPLYLLIVTNISILAQHILSEKQKRSARVVDIPSGIGLNHLGDALEIGLMLQRVMGSLFMDCSIFSVVVVCGVSIAKSLGW